jgi:hypothetical protein
MDCIVSVKARVCVTYIGVSFATMAPCAIRARRQIREATLPDIAAFCAEVSIIISSIYHLSIIYLSSYLSSIYPLSILYLSSITIIVTVITAKLSGYLTFDLVLENTYYEVSSINCAEGQWALEFSCPG